MNGYHHMPSRVTAIKWLGVLQIIHGILIFILTLVLFSIDFDENKIDTKFWYHTLLAILLCIMALGAGVSGAAMSRSEGLSHNISCKNVCTTLSTLNMFAAMFFMIIAGTHVFYDVDKNEDLGQRANWYKACFSMVLIIFILAFFDLVVAIITVVLCALWTPREEKGPAPFVSERMDEPYVIREERMPYKRNGGSLPVHSYHQDPYYSHRPLPALRY